MAVPITTAENGSSGNRICSADVLTRVTGKKRPADDASNGDAKVDGKGDGKGKGKRARKGRGSGPTFSAFQADLAEDDPWAFIYSHEGMGRSDNHDFKEHKVTVQAASHDDPEENEKELGTSWRRGMAELRKSRPPAGLGEPQRNKGGEDAAAIVKLLRRAIRKDAWELITGPRVLLRVKDVIEACKHMEVHECEAVLQACALRYTLFPMERRLCSLWTMTILDARGAELIGEHRVQAALRPLRAFLEKAHGRATSQDRVTEGIACLGKWRLALSLRTDGPAAAGDEGESGDDGDDKE